jgi:hypothetical protein
MTLDAMPSLGGWSGRSYYWVMPAYKMPSAADRITAAANARRAMLEKFQSRPAPDDPAVAERQAALKAVVEARERREAERQAARDAEAARLEAEKAAAIAKQEAEAAAQAAYVARKNQDAATAQADYKARALALAAEQKAARDARYARRKAR